MLHLSGLLSASSLASKICYASRQPGLPLQGQTLRSLALTRKFLAAPVFPPEDNKLTGRKEVIDHEEVQTQTLATSGGSKYPSIQTGRNETCGVGNTKTLQARAQEETSHP